MRCRLPDDDAVTDQVLRQLFSNLQQLILVYGPQPAEHTFAGELRLCRLLKEQPMPFHRAALR
jgi:hypothetical protein